MGQQAGMDIDAAIGGDVQYALRQDPSVSHHSDGIGLEGTKLLHRFLLPEVFRLIHGDIMGKGHLLHRRKDHLHSSALGSVRLGVHTHHLTRSFQKLF